MLTYSRLRSSPSLSLSLSQRSARAKGRGFRKKKCQNRVVGWRLHVLVDFALRRFLVERAGDDGHQNHQTHEHIRHDVPVCRQVLQNTIPSKAKRRATRRHIPVYPFSKRSHHDERRPAKASDHFRQTKTTKVWTGAESFKDLYPANAASFLPTGSTRPPSRSPARSVVLLQLRGRRHDKAHSRISNLESLSLAAAAAAAAAAASRSLFAGFTPDSWREHTHGSL